MLKDAPLLLLDEATSAVDNETEAALQRSIEQVTQGRTAIIIAHRLSTIRNAEEIISMVDGAIVERGKHEDLLANNGVYASQWQIQTGQR